MQPKIKSALHIVWFKRDLRVVDHIPLVSACQSGAVLPLFCWEETVLTGADYAIQHQQFTRECLSELKVALENMGLQLHESSVGILQTLTLIAQNHTIAALYSHEETGNGATFAIDLLVKKWCENQHIPWHETPQNGVVRRLKSRDHWNTSWEKRMREALMPAPRDALAAVNMMLPNAIHPMVAGDDKPKRQQGGRARALRILNSFLVERAAGYRGGISSPLKAIKNGSRLSPYIAFGCVSMREVVQASREQAMSLNNQNVFDKKLAAGLKGFESRLHWHCHFMQKLEDAPFQEFENLHSAYDGLRDSLVASVEQKRRLQAWQTGTTGWPLVDACMAMLRHTGWINFRMRAMLMSTASYLFWLHWRESGLHLAREFLDYEPGIHWPQSQMQSGTTGINTLRIYNPIKQAQDHDPKGDFVRHWLPALKNVPDTWIFEPWLMPNNLQLKYGCILDKDYPMPVLTVEYAIRRARLNLTALRKDDDVKREAQGIVKKHGSRAGMAGGIRDKNGNIIAKKSSKLKQTEISAKTKQQLLF